MENARFWSRVGQWFKHGGRGQPDAGSLPGLSSDGLLAEDQTESTSADRLGGLTWSRRRQREQAYEKLQQGYQQVVGLIDSINQHLQAQDRRAEQVGDAMTQLAQTTARISEAASAQSQTLGVIATQLEAGNDRARRWEQPLMEIPKLADAQREALGAISKELESGHEADRRMAQTMEGFRQAVSSWGDSSAAATDILRQMKEAASRRDEDLNTFIEAQQKRFNWLFGLTLLLAAAAIATGVIALFK